MDTMEALLTRRSIRKYRPEPVPVEDLKEILAAGATAPSAVNMQHWYFVAVQDPAALEEVKAIMGGVVEKFQPVLEERFSRHPEQIGIDDPKNASSFCKLVDAIHSQGAAASAELDHGGALCAPEFLGKTPAGPSAYVDDWGDEVRAMSEEEIVHAAKMFGQAAANAKHYGFDMVTVHAGHGWLIHQFLSPLTNFRQDHWGGTPEKRLNFLLLCGLGGVIHCRE